jgi:hypothetical protein
LRDRERYPAASGSNGAGAFTGASADTGSACVIGETAGDA